MKFKSDGFQYFFFIYVFESFFFVKFQIMQVVYISIFFLNFGEFDKKIMSLVLCSFGYIFVQNFGYFYKSFCKYVSYLYIFINKCFIFILFIGS